MLRIKYLIKLIVPEHWRKRLRSIQWRIECIWGPMKGIKSIRLYRRFQKELSRYRSLPGAERVDPCDLWPCLFDKTEFSNVPAHYFYQSAWIARRLEQIRPQFHVDIGSQLDLVGIVSAFIPMVFVDIRPLSAELPNVQRLSGSIIHLPFADSSVNSLSCLHVIEHVGLGRYGDTLDVQGTLKASRELTRVLAGGGSLFLSVPIGRDRTCFNAHRIHSPHTILKYFEGLDLIEFSCEDDSGTYHENCNPGVYQDASYCCGMFWLKKRRL